MRNINTILLLLGCSIMMLYGTCGTPVPKTYVIEGYVINGDHFTPYGNQALEFRRLPLSGAFWDEGNHIGTSKTSSSGYFRFTYAAQNSGKIWIYGSGLSTVVAKDVEINTNINRTFYYPHKGKVILSTLNGSSYTSSDTLFYAFAEGATPLQSKVGPFVDNEPIDTFTFSAGANLKLLHGMGKVGIDSALIKYVYQLVKVSGHPEIDFVQMDIE